MVKVLLSIALLSILNIDRSFGFGENGHRIVGQIAETRLSPTAKSKIQAILGTESLAEASTWADEVRSDSKFEAYDCWHYVEIPDGMTYQNAPKNPEGDVIMGIQTMIDVIQGKSTKFKPKEALRYLIHFIGDLHQPLHVGNGRDHGGNLCIVKFAGRNTNLHVVWDSSMIDSRSLSFTEYSQFLNRGDLVTAAKIRKWTEGSYIDWAHDSMTARDALYPPNNSLTPANEMAGVKERNYCKKTDQDTIPTALIPVLGFGYEYKFKKTMDEQLTKGGVRLGHILNEIFR